MYVPTSNILFMIITIFFIMYIFAYINNFKFNLKVIKLGLRNMYIMKCILILSYIHKK